ncbi:outer membrane beta-barrel protein [Foetidibacter luteolus]|uniref:outer membrane beta-barrel protein n=1 Tax=Foetidibacter luteolus TaxID=2608880 RepID=UPI00129A6647|nr:outer membrane beta-barrel protein [Foetidibacter luteolus]
MPKRCLYLLLFICCFFTAIAAEPGDIVVTVTDTQNQPLPHATVELLRQKDSSLVKVQLTDTAGKAVFRYAGNTGYLLRVSRTSYNIGYVLASQQPVNVILQPSENLLGNVTVTARKPLVQQLAGKTVINVDAAISNTGTTVMEVLEKSPGISVDRDGNISLKGRQGVLVLIDDKPTYLGAAELASLLNSMNSSQVELLELMDIPPAKYDAAGSAGVINIKTKKNRQQGFNGNLNLSYGQGRYPKSNNSLLLNYRNGLFNFFLNYSNNYNRAFTDLYALRTYYHPVSGDITSLLEQPTYITFSSNNNTLRTGFDYYLSKKTTLGLALTGTNVARRSNGNASAYWLGQSAQPDSVIDTRSNNRNQLRNAAININLRHSISAAQEISADVDWLGYSISSNQHFENTLTGNNGYTEAVRGDIPSEIKIFSGKADYTASIDEHYKLSVGWKSSFINTDNQADYFLREGEEWLPDAGKTNHFVYAENIHAIYSSLEYKRGRWNGQAGLRYETTHYEATQKNMAAGKDSAFSRNYSSLFPTAMLSFEADSLHRFTLTAGRRIDRPAFQKLNPFVFIINKYTYQQGNTMLLPQYSWNIELSHSFKELLTTAISYSYIKDYASQLFLTKDDNILVYTDGNMGKMQNIGLSVSTQLTPLPWWNLTAEVVANYKRIETVLWKEYKASIRQANFNINNQFRLGKGWSAELSGYYITKAMDDIQEILDPTGQVSMAFAKQLFQNKATLKLAARDVFYTQVMQGLTTFQYAKEFFALWRDSRVVTLTFSWRFGKTFKAAPRRSGGATDEMNRVAS